MKNLTQLTLVLLAMFVAFAGCDAAKDAASGAMDKAGEMTDMEIGGMKISDLKEKFTGITEGFSNVNEENADELATKVEELDGSIGEIDLEAVPAPAKAAASGIMGPFAETIKSKMEGLPDVVKSKLEPVVTPLLEKLAAFGG